MKGRRLAAQGLYNMNMKLVVAVTGFIFASVMGGYWVGKHTQPSHPSPIPDLSQGRVSASLDVSSEENTSVVPASKSDSLSDVLAIRSSFARDIELYQLATHSDVEQLERLILESVELTNPVEQEGVWLILFSRYVDIDPQRAVILAGQSPFIDNHLVDDVIWQNWAEVDLKAAIHHLKTVTPQARKDHAAQVLYFTQAMEDADRAQLIERVVGIKADWLPKAAYTKALAAQSLERAIEHVNTITPGNHQRAVAYQLAQLITKRLAIEALALSSRFDSMATRARYRKGVFTQLGNDDPELVLDRWIDNPGTRSANESVFYAFQTLVKQDMNKALSYFDRLEPPSVRTRLADLVVIEMGDSDMLSAIQWAEAQEEKGIRGFSRRAVQELAHSDALQLYDLVSTFPEGADQQNYLAIAIGKLAEWDLNVAIDKINGLPDSETKIRANATLLQSWMRSDSKGAFAYAVENHERIGPNAMFLFDQVIQNLEPQAVLDAASKFTSGVVSGWAQPFAKSLLNKGSLQEAHYMLSGYQGSDFYDSVQNALVGELARDDFAKARDYGLSLPAGRARDQALVSLATRMSRKEPAQAAQLLAAIHDDNNRKYVVSDIARSWYTKDPDAARRWLGGLDKKEQEQAISNIASRSAKYDDEILALTATIGSKVRREISQVSLLVNLYREDPNRARQIAESLGIDLNDYLSEFGLN